MFGADGMLADSAAAAKNNHGLSEKAGLVPRAVRDAMAAVRDARGSRGIDATLTLSYLELYKEKFTDLFTGNDVKLFRIGTGVTGDEYRAALGAEDDHNAAYVWRRRLLLRSRATAAASVLLLLCY